MSTPLILTNFTSGELTPSLFGRVDQSRYHNGASTARNAFVNYRGGLYSRAGTAYVGFSKQTGREYPPRLIQFQFSNQQGLALEFGNYYMRVIINGAFVTESEVPITNITQSNPAVVTATASGALFASPINTFVFSSYNSGDLITLAGGTYSSPAVLSVQSTVLLNIGLNDPGTSGVYAPGDTVTLAGGNQISPSIITLSSTQVISATVASGGTGGMDGTQIVTGTTGTGTFFSASVIISGGTITSVEQILVPGNYTVNPTVPSAEPVTGGGLTGATLDLQIGILAFTLTTAGSFLSNPPGNTFTQASTSGAGLGATFQFGLFGPLTVSFSDPGNYTVFPSNPVSQASTSGSGLGAQFNVSSGSIPPFNDGDWVFLSGIAGMTELNGGTYVVGSATATSFALYDVYGNPIDSTGFTPYAGGGEAARILTVVSPYAEQDLDYLKFTQSADVISFACVNQKTFFEYLPYDLTRDSNVDWVFTQINTAETVFPPTSTYGSASPPPITTPPTPTVTNYQYVVTSVSSSTGSESVASPIARILNAVDIAAVSGSVRVTWSAVQGISQYNIYKATPGYTFEPPVGSLFGYVGTAYGTRWIDSNFVADFATVPPLHKDPFAIGPILSLDVITQGTSYTRATVMINTSTGSGANIEPIIVNGAIVAYFIRAAGAGYLPTDTVTIIGNGTGATAALNVGPQSGTYPGVVSYFQQRRVYANTLNNPDTYFMSQPGAYTNFDSRIPTIATDAIIGTPWSFQVNGIQWLVNMPGGLIVLTGLSAWQLTGAGGSSQNPQTITPSSQTAQPQAYNGASSTVPPIRIDFDIIYVQAKGSIYRDISYNFFTNIYTGEDLTINSSHLFNDFTIVQHAWCEEPSKILWSIRNDGVLLSMTYMKPEKILGWARHDTNGIFVSVCSVTEPPIDALYLAIQRNFPKGQAYVIERMDDRLWQNVEDCWCVDCGFQLSQPEPNANLNASSPYGLGAISGFTNLIGGQNYSASTILTVIDDNGIGPGTGAIVMPIIVSGVITGLTISNPGQNYIYPSLVIEDPTNAGSGASARLTLDNSATFTASMAIFSPANIGDVIRMGGGIATITSYIDNQNVIAQITDPIAAIQPNSVNSLNPQGLVQTQESGSWTLTTPISTLTNLQPLAGMIVTGLADGQVIPPTQVSMNGTVTLSTPASAIIIGLGYQVQIQTPYTDTGEPTIQGQRKKLSAVTVRIESSLNIDSGANQPDGSTLSPMEIAPIWNGLGSIPNRSRAPYNSSRVPLFTGDERIYLSGGYAIPGQVAFEQNNPLPIQILAIIPEIWSGDTPQQAFSGGKSKQNSGR